MSLPHTLTIESPDWLIKAEKPTALINPLDRMQWVLQLVEKNIRFATGGPFAAAVFDEDSGLLIAAATNQVVPSHCSTAHAELLAIALAQQSLGSHDLSSNGRYQLVSSAEPCAMCTGALAWSGIHSLIYGAGKQDVEQIGFQEGQKSPDWADYLTRRGIVVHAPVLQAQSAALLQQYRQSAGHIY